MKVALVKQCLDLFGPWATTPWTGPQSLLRRWPFKATYFEMTTLVQADWYVVDQQLDTAYIQAAVLDHPGRANAIRELSEGVVPATAIPFEQYDLIVSIDPILEPPSGCKTAFAYFMQEHGDPLYQQSLRHRAPGYDVFLAHMLDGVSDLSGLDVALSLPYMRDPDAARALVSLDDKEDSAWADWRLLCTLAQRDGFCAAVNAAALRLGDILELPVRHRQFVREEHRFDLPLPPPWGDFVQYLEQVARSKWFVSLGRDKGAGQSICDGAVLGSICIGESNKPYHRLLCHPEALCAGLHELPRRLARIRSSPDLQHEVLDYQAEALERCFKRRPLELLARLVELKRSSCR